MEGEIHRAERKTLPTELHVTKGISLTGIIVSVVGCALILLIIRRVYEPSPSL